MILLHKIVVTLRSWFLCINGSDIILESASPLAVGVSEGIFLRVLLFLERLVVNASEVIIMKLYVFQLGAEDVHLAAVLKDDLVVEVKQRLLRLVGFGVFHECLPDLGLFEDEYLDDGAVGGEELIEIVMRDNIAELIIDAHQEHGAREY